MTLTSPAAVHPPSRPPFDRVAYGAFILLIAALMGSMMVADAFRQPMRPHLVAVGVACLVVIAAAGIGPAIAFYRGDRVAIVRSITWAAGFALPQVRPGRRAVQVGVFALLVPVVLVWVQVDYLLPVLPDLTGITPPVGVTDSRDSWYAGVPVALVVASIIAGVAAEEFVFRGPGLMVWRLRDHTASRGGRATLVVIAVVGGMALSSIGFGFLHSNYGAWNVLTAAIFGASIYPLTLVTGSLWPAIVAHTVWNIDAFGVLNLF